MPPSQLQEQQEKYCISGKYHLLFTFLPFVSVPIAVSLVEKDCDAATNILSVTYEPLKDGQQKQEIAVCVKV